MAPMKYIHGMYTHRTQKVVKLESSETTCRAEINRVSVDIAEDKQPLGIRRVCMP